MPATLTRSGEGVTFAGDNAAPPAALPSAKSPGPNSPSPVNNGVPLQTSAPIRTATSVPPTPVTVKVVTPGMSEKEWGFSFNPLNLLWFIIIFVVVWVILFSSRMHMVTDLINGERKINSGKLLLWTVIIGIVICILFGVGLAAWRSPKGGAVVRASATV